MPLGLQAGTVIDLAEIPWTALGIAFAAVLAVVELRLIKAGFVRQADLDGMGRRVDEKFVAMDREREALKSMVIMNRDNLDDTRDRVTRLEGQFEASNQLLTKIDGKLDMALPTLLRHEAEIEILKRERGNREGA